MQEHNYAFRELQSQCSDYVSDYVDSFYVKGVVETCVWSQVWRQTEWIRRPVTQEIKPIVGLRFGTWARQPAPRFHLATE